MHQEIWLKLQADMMLGRGSVWFPTAPYHQYNKSWVYDIDEDDEYNVIWATV